MVSLSEREGVVPMFLNEEGISRISGINVPVSLITPCTRPGDKFASLQLLLGFSPYVTL